MDHKSLGFLVRLRLSRPTREPSEYKYFRTIEPLEYKAAPYNTDVVDLTYN